MDFLKLVFKVMFWFVAGCGIVVCGIVLAPFCLIYAVIKTISENNKK